MKKVILISVLLGLVTNSAFATYYKTTTSNCNPDAMLATVNSATAEHRAVITEVTCEHAIPRPVKQKFVRPAPKHFVANKKFVRHAQRKYVPVITYVPAIRIITVTEKTCSCCDCGC